MFSIPLPSSLNSILAASVMPRDKGAADDSSVDQSVQPQPESAADDPLADLDQRVRSIGEW